MSRASLFPTRRLLPLAALCAGLVGALPLAAAPVAALGRLVPARGLVEVATAPGDRFDTVAVEDGQQVVAGAPLARLASAKLAQLRVLRAQAELDGRRKLADSVIESTRHQATAAESELQAVEGRYHAAKKGLAPAQLPAEIDDPIQAARAAADAKFTEAKLNVARAEMEVRLQLQSCEIALEEARLALAHAELRAPASGRVLNLHAAVGSASGGVFCRIADTSSMVVVAEVFEGDAPRLKRGQKAEIKSAALPSALTGKVLSVGGIVGRHTLQNLDADTPPNAHVVEVVIEVDDATAAARFVLLQVDVAIDT